MKRRLEQFYASFGDKGVMFILYAFSVVVNSLMTMCMELPAVFPEEISAAGIAAFYSGKNWSEMLGQIGVQGGYIHSILYTPLFLVFDNPYALYKAMLVINAIIISFIPLISYHLAGKLGVERVRQKLLAALCCGLYVSVLTCSKFITADAITCLMVWVLILCVYAAWDKKNRYTRFTMSLLTGFLCAVAFAANPDLIAAVLAVLLTVIITRVFFREKLMNIPAFCASLAVSFVAEHFARVMVMRYAANVQRNALSEFFIELNPTGGFDRIFGEIYTFMTDSFGMGALAAALFAAIIFAWIREGIKNKEKLLDDGTKVYEPVKHKYSIRLTVFALFQFITVFTLTIILPIINFTGMNAASAIGERSRLIAPAALFFVMIFVFRYAIDIKKLLLGTGIYAYSCLCFGLTYYINSGAVNQGDLPLITPFRFGEDILSEMTGMSCIIMSSCVFSLFVLLIVFTSCAKKYIIKFVSVTMLGILIYNTIYSAFFYLPQTAGYFSEKNEPYKKAAELLYNNPQSPPIIVYEAEPELAATLRFLKLETSVRIMKKGDKVPESCLLVTKNSVKAPFEGGSYDIVGKTDMYTVYAYGESARDFIRYSSASSGGAPRLPSSSSSSSSRISSSSDRKE